jgi:hypothetical protein
MDVFCIDGAKNDRWRHKRLTGHARIIDANLAQVKYPLEDSRAFLPGAYAPGTCASGAPKTQMHFLGRRTLLRDGRLG